MDTDERREEFIRTAFYLFREKGVEDTSISDITKRMGVTRSLFYHYFDDKQAIVDAVIDLTANQFAEQAVVWYQDYDYNQARASLIEIVNAFRTHLFCGNPLAKAIMSDDKSSLRHLFCVRVAQILAQRFATIRETQGTPPWADELLYPRETLYVMGIGLLSLAIRNPDVDDEVFADIAANMLRLRL